MDYTRIIKELDRIHRDMSSSVAFATTEMSKEGIHYGYGALCGGIIAAQRDIDALVDTVKEMEEDQGLVDTLSPMPHRVTPGQTTLDDAEGQGRR